MPEQTWFCVRRNGVAKRRGWVGSVTLRELPAQVGARDADVVEACVVDAVRPVRPGRFSNVFYNRSRGIVGMEVSLGSETMRYAPTRMVAANLSFGRALENFLHQCGATRRQFDARGAVRALSARQYLVVPGKATVELVRGSTVVPSQPAGELARDLADGIGGWMVRNLSAEGALPYKYWPSRGNESPADNAIRRFLATIALSRLAELRGSRDVRDAARRNLRFNLKRYFRDIGGGRGVIVERSDAKLGAAALAALAILENPARGEFATELGMLAKGVDSLFDPELGFRTFFFPPERDGDNWNFYAGEAMLFWAEALRRNAVCAPPLERCVAAFRCCRERHRRSRNPAFVPWHAQACTSLFALTRGREFSDFAFEICDWLLPMQQWDGVASDLRGRFYDPKRPHFGPPHAASTGAYCEGLADAAALAGALGERRRAAAYALAVGRGLRSLRQLQFRDDRDAFYISRRERVMGGLRTEVYDNAVRVDSAGHALAAAVKVLRPMAFPEGRE